jgi:hypothetical protein
MRKEENAARENQSDIGRVRSPGVHIFLERVASVGKLTPTYQLTKKREAGSDAKIRRCLCLMPANVQMLKLGLAQL